MSRKVGSLRERVAGLATSQEELGKKGDDMKSGGEKYVIYLDTGGTFSDAVIIREDGSFVTGKASTTPDDLETCFFNGIQNGAERLGKGLKEVLENCSLLGLVLRRGPMP